MTLPNESKYPPLVWSAVSKWTHVVSYAKAQLSKTTWCPALVVGRAQEQLGVHQDLVLWQEE